MATEERLPGTTHLVAYRGDDWSQTFVFKRADVPIDAQASTVASSAVDNAGVTHDLQVTTGPNGEVTIAMPVDGLPTGSYWYDVEVTEANGLVTTWVRGKLTVEQDVTHGN